MPEVIDEVMSHPVGLAVTLVLMASPDLPSTDDFLNLARTVVSLVEDNEKDSTVILAAYAAIASYLQLHDEVNSGPVIGA